MARSSSRPSRTYRSKVDGGILAILGLAIVAMLAAPITAWLNTGNARAALVGLVMLPAIGFIAWIVTGTSYTLAGRELIVRCGPFRWRIDVSDIRSITPARGIGVRIRSSRSSPALSMDRLEIIYGGGKSLMISPAEKETFLKDIASRGGGK